MKETNNREANKLLLSLVMLLIAATALQGFFLFRIYRGSEERDKTSEASEVQLVPQASAPAASPKAPGSRNPSTLLDPFGRAGFDPDDAGWDWDADDWDPFAEVQRMQQRMNRLFDDSFGRFRLSPGFDTQWSALSFAPRLDLSKEDERYVIRVDIPGVEDPNVTVNIEDRQLTVSGQIDESVEDRSDDQVLRKERRSGQFRRSITLPGPVNAKEMAIEYDRGVLTVTVPKGRETAASKTLTIP